jgi:hypothetical protein
VYAARPLILQLSWPGGARLVFIGSSAGVERSVTNAGEV